MGVCEGECIGRNPGDEPLTLTRCHSCGLPQLFEAFEGWHSVCGQAYNLKVIKRKFSVFLLLKHCFSFTVAYFFAWWGRHASCQEISYSKRKAKFKKEGKQKISPLVVGGGESIINK